VIPFAQFSSPNFECAAKNPVQTRALLTDLQLLPAGCIVIDFAKRELRISPSACPGPLPRTFNVRAEAWLYDPKLLVNAPHNFVEFRVVIVGPASCRGFAASSQTLSPIQRVGLYSNFDAPANLYAQYSSYLTMLNPLYTLSNMGGFQYCDLEWWYPSVFVGQD
jgi:hypothetical protein